MKVRAVFAMLLYQWVAVFDQCGYHNETDESI
jgi:hypothetical protein